MKKFFNRFLSLPGVIIVMVIMCSAARIAQTLIWHTSALEGDGTEMSSLGISADAITNRELSSTAVTPASYTFTALTVDADGRITAASNGTPVSDADKGDITTSSGATVWDIDAGTIGPTEIAVGGVDLATTDVTGNLSTSHMNSGTSASSTTFWRGDGTWTVPTVNETYGVGWDSDTDAPEKDDIYDILETSDNIVDAFKALGSAIQAVTVGSIASPSTTVITLSDNTAVYRAIYVKKPMTLTGVKFFQVTQGSYTADQNNYVALYSYSGGTCTQVAISSNNGSLWKGSSTSWQTVAFTGTYAASPGIYFIGVLYNQSAQTTAPTIAGTAAPSTGTLAYDFTNSAKLTGTVASQNTLPSSQAMSGVTAQTAAQSWLALY